MIRTRSLNTFLMMSGMIFLAGLVALTLLDPGLTKVDSIKIDWKLPYPDRLPPNLTINNRCRKHLGEPLDAWKIYQLHLQGKCTMEDRYCRTSESHGPMMLFLCEDPITGITGGLFIILEKSEIISGYGNGETTFEYWTQEVIDQEVWGSCY